MYKGSVLVTGCDSGLGLALCGLLPKHGFFVIAVCKTAEGLQRAKKALDVGSSKPDCDFAEGYDCNHSSGSGSCHLVDISSSSEVEVFHGKVLDSVKNKTFPPVYALINNAGIWRFSLLEDAMNSAERCNEEVDLWKEVMETNLFGTLRITLMFASSLTYSSFGWHPRVVFISSVLDRHAMPGQGAYVASKFAVTGLHETLCHELIARDIYPVLLRPGALWNTKLFNRDLKLDDPNDKEELSNRKELLRASYRLLLNFAGDCNSVAQQITDILLEQRPRLEYSNVTGAFPFMVADRIPRNLFIQLVRCALYGIGGVYYCFRRFLAMNANFIRRLMM